MAKRNANPQLHDALSALAGLFEGGHLMADTDPVEFIHVVHDEILARRNERGDFLSAMRDAIGLLHCDKDLLLQAARNAERLLSNYVKEAEERKL